MTFIHDHERDVVRAVAGLVECNPFLPDRLELERRALGDTFVPNAAVWHAAGATAPRNENTIRLAAVVEQLGTTLQQRLAAGAHATPTELDDYHRVVLYVLFQRYESDWLALLKPADPAAERPTRFACYGRFAEDVAYFFRPVARSAAPPVEPAHLFAPGLPSPARLPLHLQADLRRFPAGGTAARQSLAIDLHPQCAPLSGAAVQPHGRYSDADHR